MQVAALEKLATAGLPILSQFIQSGVKESAKKSGIPGAEDIAQVIADGLNQITNAAQQAKAEISGTLKTVGETTTLAKGFALTGADFGKLPNLLKDLRSVNVFKSKLEQDLSESALRQGATNIQKFVTDESSKMLKDIFKARSNR